MDVERTSLPGIGLQHTFLTRAGRQMAVISHRSGRRDLVLYRADDPDTAAETLRFTPEEADALADLLTSSRVVERLAELGRQVGGLVSEQIPLPEGSPYAGRPLAATQTRTRTSASIVAVVRNHEVTASPRPDFVFEPGDVVVVVGSEEATAAAATLLLDG